MQFFEFRIYQVYPYISFLKKRYDMDMTWLGYDILLASDSECRTSRGPAAWSPPLISKSTPNYF